MTLLSTNNLAIGYKNNSIRTGLFLSIKEGEAVAIIGRNGAGKSTLLKTIASLLDPIEGEILVGGRNMVRITKKELARTIAYISTESAGAGGLKLREMIALGRGPYTGRMGLLAKEDREVIDTAMNLVGIAHKRDSFLSELSDGERQKGLIARGLVQQTPLILMDEPFSFLDVVSRLEMLALIKNLAETQKKSILFSTHEVTDALRIADRIWLFSDSEVYEGSPQELIDAGKLDKLFANPHIEFDRNTMEFRIKGKS